MSVATLTANSAISPPAAMLPRTAVIRRAAYRWPPPTGLQLPVGTGPRLHPRSARTFLGGVRVDRPRCEPPRSGLAVGIEFGADAGNRPRGCYKPIVTTPAQVSTTRSPSTATALITVSG